MTTNDNTERFLTFTLDAYHRFCLAKGKRVKRGDPVPVATQNNIDVIFSLLSMWGIPDEQLEEIEASYAR